MDSPARGVDPRALTSPLAHALRDEAYARVCRKALNDSAVTAQAELAAIEGQLTPVDFLLTLANRPRPAAVARNAARENLRKLQQSIEGCQRIEVELARVTEGLLEAHVRNSDPAYAKGIAAMENLEDWTRALSRFELKLRDFLKAVGQARGAATSGYNAATQRMSTTALTMLVEARTAAEELEDEITFINHLSELHMEMIAATPCAKATIPTVPTAPYRAWVEGLQRLAIGPMQEEFNRILEVVGVLERDGVSQLNASVATSRKEHLELARSYVLAERERLRQFAEEHWYEAGESPDALRRLERRFFRGERVIHFDIVIK